MTDSFLLLRVHLHEPRFHGRPEWPPSPARVFQALVAGAAPHLGNDSTRKAFLWLEELPPPSIGAPMHVNAKPVTYYVPNNDLDALHGDPGRVGEIRTAKCVQPRLLSPGIPLLYAWSFEGPCPHAARIVELANGLYQLGRGVDMAYATAEIHDHKTLDTVLAQYSGVLHRPGAVPHRSGLLCPRAGSLESLEVRHRALSRRFRVETHDNKTVGLFIRAPKAFFGQVAYDCVPVRFVFELRSEDALERFAPIALEQARELVVAVRDAAVERLTQSGMPVKTVTGVLVGSRPGEPVVVPQHARARILPLPSIGHPDADPRIRRILLEVPQACPLTAADVCWSVSGLNIDGMRVAQGDDRMLRHYRGPTAHWQTVTPAALPAGRRRIAPMALQPKDAAERELEERQATHAILQALRHAQVPASALHVDVQREPYLTKGERAEAFDAPPRFPKHRLWHFRVTLDGKVSGPLAIGDGRYMGLGLMMPVPGRPRS